MGEASCGTQSTGELKEIGQGRRSDTFLNSTPRNQHSLQRLGQRIHESCGRVHIKKVLSSYALTSRNADATPFGENQAEVQGKPQGAIPRLLV